MMVGNEYHRTINSYTTKYYLLDVRKDFEEDSFNKAVEAIDKNIKHYSASGKENSRGIEKIVKEFKSL